MRKSNPGSTRVNNSSSTNFGVYGANPVTEVQKQVKMAERGWTWSDKEIAAFLAKWVDKTIQTQFLGSVRNIVPYRVIANELCCEIIKALKKKYKETMDSP